MNDASLCRLNSALTRAAIYEFFALAFAYPEEARIEQVRAAASECLRGEVSVPILRLAVAARELESESLEPVYARLTTFTSSPDCPAFETAYFGSDAQQQTQRMADIAGFYRAFGVDPADGGFRPDELSVELEFMAFLSRKEAYAEEHLGAPRVGQANRAQRLFLEDHLGRWAPVFASRFAARAPAGHFYEVLGSTLAAWLGAECQRTGARPAEVSGEAPRIWPAPVSHGPEFAGEPSFIPQEELLVR